MTGHAAAPATAWLLIAALGVGTFALRLSFIGLYGRLGTLPPGVERALRFVPVAVLAALVLPALVILDGPGGPAGGARLVAGVVGGVVAWRTDSMTATIAAGMATLWGVRLALG